MWEVQKGESIVEGIREQDVPIKSGQWQNFNPHVAQITLIGGKLSQKTSDSLKSVSFRSEVIIPRDAPHLEVNWLDSPRLITMKGENRLINQHTRGAF